MKLFIGNKAYSSWSLRGWLAARHSGLPFEEVTVPLYDEDWNRRREGDEFAPSGGKVPILWDGSDIVVWDSLAIIETLAELAPDAGIWPADQYTRAVARSVCAEMHSGFYRLRRDMPMDLRASRPGEQHTEGAVADAKRIIARWADCRARFGAGGPFLFGEWSAADIMYAPVVGRFRTYGVPADAETKAYMDAVWDQPDMAAWVAAAVSEPYVIETV